MDRHERDESGKPPPPPPPAGRWDHPRSYPPRDRYNGPNRGDRYDGRRQGAPRSGAPRPGPARARPYASSERDSFEYHQPAPLPKGPRTAKRDYASERPRPADPDRQQRAREPDRTHGADRPRPRDTPTKRQRDRASDFDRPNQRDTDRPRDRVNDADRPRPRDRPAQNSKNYYNGGNNDKRDAPHGAGRRPDLNSRIDRRNATPQKRPRDEPQSPRHDPTSDRKKFPTVERDVRGLKNVPSGPRSVRREDLRDSFVASGPQGKSFNKPTKVLKSRSALGFNDEHSDEEVESRANTNANKKDRRPRKPKAYLITGPSGAVPYERLTQVGEGTYGKVYKAKNVTTGRLVAMKRLRLETEKEGFPITAMREISLLQSFQHENVSGLLEMMADRTVIYMIFDYAEHDLTALLAHPQVEFTDATRKDIFMQLLVGINYLHEKRIMHRDIKGSNILMNQHGVLKITDFGLARKMKNHKVGESPQYTNRVITLWYRPPELLMGSTNYGREVDMWGLGCILMELFTKRPLFQGNNELTQLQEIFKVMGTPTYQQWPEMDDLPWYHLFNPKKHSNKFTEQFTKVLKTTSCLTLCQGLLALNPVHRSSARIALESPWFKEEPLPERLKLEGFEELHEFEVKRRRKAKQEEAKIQAAASA